MSEHNQIQAPSGAAESRSRRAWFSPNALQREVAKLRAAVAEAASKATRQSMLMREADHRIKNSLQIVASLVRRGARGEASSAESAANAVAVRIDEIAHLHDLLQLSSDGDVVDLGALLQRVRQSIELVVAVEPRRIEVLLDAGSIKAPAAFARPVMMSVSELVMNAIRHAFPDGRCGTIRVTAAEVAGSLCVVVADDGVGLPPEPADGPGFGIKLVRAMAAQIGGTLVAENDRGARFTLVAPLSGR
jgi:two-component sensor histidine kinase